MQYNKKICATEFCSGAKKGEISSETGPLIENSSVIMANKNTLYWICLDQITSVGLVQKKNYFKNSTVYFLYIRRPFVRLS